MAVKGYLPCIVPKKLMALRQWPATFVPDANDEALAASSQEMSDYVQRLVADEKGGCAPRAVLRHSCRHV